MNERALGRGWTFNPAARVGRSILQRLIIFPMLAFLTPVKVEERSRLRGLGPPVIIVANHVSHLDTPVVLRALPAKVRRSVVVAAAKDYFYTGRLRGALVSLSLATIPFDRGEGSSESLAECQELAERGWSLLVFPEGTRSPSGELGRVRRGVAVIACNANVPVLPIYIHGLAQVMPKGTVAPLPGGVFVQPGELIGPGTDVDTLRDRIESELRRLEKHPPDWGSTQSRFKAEA